MAYYTDFYSWLKDAVENIRDWIDDNSDKVLYWLVIVVFGLSTLGAIIAAIVTWVDDGFWKAFWQALGSAIALGIGFYVLSIIAGIGTFVAGLFKYLFANIYVLEIVVLVLLGLAYFNSAHWANNAGNFDFSFADRARQEQVQIPQYEMYICTASKVLNVRETPDPDGKVVGAIRAKDRVAVYEITDNGFARIKYNGNDAYISTKYIIKANSY